MDKGGRRKETKHSTTKKNSDTDASSWQLLRCRKVLQRKATGRRPSSTRTAELLRQQECLAPVIRKKLQKNKKRDRAQEPESAEASKHAEQVSEEELTPLNLLIMSPRTQTKTIEMTLVKTNTNGQIPNHVIIGATHQAYLEKKWPIRNKRSSFVFNHQYARKTTLSSLHLHTRKCNLKKPATL
jgi:hypothetical protein